ncbi:hypothetical protein SDC9_37068 [bioreactor metagenome]|uniref:Uncharacterized protein n=1 Tax=bioreactor metagenome TaxID=1076179 RepID=A0A644VHZ9_9ZZZZ|nr:type II toxin-antitoxin system RelE/ParE family toxin [Paludibacter sp.]
MSLLFKREIYYFENHYLNFFENLTPAVKKKFNWVLQLISTIERVSDKYLKHLSGTSGLYEIRIDYGSNIYRIFCFFNKVNALILLNVFQKKSNKTPSKEIVIAEKIRKRYYYEQNK